jgi:ribosomal protein L29
MALNDRQGLEAALADINDLIRQVLSQIASTENSRNFTAAEKAPRLAALRAELAGYRAQQAALTQALNQLSLNDQRKTASAADITAQGQVARDDGANPKAPAPPAQTVIGADGRVVTKGFAAPTNATKPATTATGDTDRGTNAELRTVAQTQAAVTSTSAAGAASAQPANPQLVRARNEETGQVYQIEPEQFFRVEVNGVGSRGDDAAQPAAPANAVVNRLDELYAGSQNAIVSQDNVLDQFASYTYSLSWYLLDNATYNSLAASDTKFISSYYLLMQSGGAPATTADAKGAETGRSPFFSLDYYMDNFVIESSVSGTPGARGAAKLTSISFTVSEPNGISLQPNLIRAVNNLYEKNGYVKPGTAVNYVEANYVMVVRFYGYDSAGNLVMPIDKRTGATDQRAAIEKFIPFRITDIQFKVANKLVEYNITGVPTDELTAFSTDCGSIPQNFQFQGKTVSDILVGTQQQVSAERLAQENLRVSLGFDARADAEARQITGAVGGPIPPPKISAAPNRVGNTEATGLCAALNLFYAEEARKRGGIADIYELQFLDPILTNASIVPPGGVDKAFAGGNPNANAASNKDPKRQNFNPAIRVRSTTAGQQIVQFIDEVMRSSSYISDQQRAVWQIDPKTGKYDWMFRGKTAQSFAWFDISCEAQVIGYDTTARRNAYRLIYKVSPYQTTMVATSEYFNPSAYRGVHKVYNYWFTGQNTQVLQHEQSFNNLWRQTISSNSSKLNSPSTAEQIRNAVNSSITWSKRFQPASNQTREGADGNVYEAAANAADMLYTTDLANITLQVIGDPAWIASPRRPQPGKFDFGPFLSDGTINYSAGVPYFEFAWNRPVDYDLETGLMDVGRNNFRTNFVDTTGGLAQESVVYMATNVKSIFNRGKFTQELKGAWLFDGIKTTMSTSNQFAADARADAEARRITQGGGVDFPNSTDLPANAGVEKTALASVVNQYPVSPSVQLLGSNITANTIAGPLPARPPGESALNFIPPAKLPSGGFGSGSNNPSLAQDTVALAVVSPDPPQLISKDA